MADVAAPLIADARGYASSALGAGVGAMNGAIAVLQGLGKSLGGGHLPNLTIAPPDPKDPGSAPVYAGSHLTPDLFNVVAPTLQDIGRLVLPADPGNAPATLTFVEPNQPTGDPDASLLANAPNVNTNFVFPTAPDLQGEIKSIVAPQILSITVPAAPTYQAPQFNGVAPVFNAPMPTGLDDQFRTNYSQISPVIVNAVTTQVDAFIDKEFPQFRTGLAAIEARLQTYLAGGSALTPQVEDAIYNRTLDKTNVDAKRASQEAWGKGARAGFTIPPPSLLSQQQDIDQERRANNARAATEIAVKQAELEQSNLQFAVTKSTELRKIAIDAGLAYYNGLVTLNGQAIEYARSVVEYVVKAFDIAARYAETQARIYEADANVYRAQLEGAMQVLHAYEATVRGLEAQVNVNRAQVDAYNARISAIKTEGDVYRSAVDAVVAQAGLQRILVELYDSRVKAYGSQVNAYSARWQGYEAAVRGQAAKMTVSAEQARAFEAQVNAFSAKVRAQATAIESTATTNRQLVDTYKARVQAYAELQHAKAEAVGIDVSIFDAGVKSFIAKASAYSEFSRAQSAQYEVQLRGLIAEANLYMEQLREFHHLDITRVTGIAQVSQTIGLEYGAMAQAAMSGMNTLAAEVVQSTV